ncbi:hypothetical protein BC830DRAFT_15545 [Chytriomyces sp. MP71]|nr:hypothetical protein BC830DRAFT_15545 [Chytriomyces sp. MP71]
MGISKRPQESNIPNDTQNENLEEIDVRKMEENHESRHEDTEMSPAESALVPSDESHNHEGSRKNTGDIAESCLATVTSISVGKSHGSTESTDHAPANMEDIAQREAASMDEGLDTTQTQLLNKLSFEYSAEDNHIQPEEAAIENGKTFSEPTAGFSPIIGTSSEVDYEAENNTQMKKITPLPPIDPNNRPLSSKSSKPSLSRPLSARILGPILTPPHNSRPTSRPISGYQQENSVLVASRRVSLPALVNAASIPSSRPLSGSTPLLNNVAPIETEPYSKDVESGGEKMNGSSRGSASAYSRRGIAGESKTGSMTPLSLPISRPLSPIKQGSQKTLAVDLLPADMNAHSNISGSRNDEATLGTIGSDIEGTPNNDDDDGDIAFNDFEQPPIEFEGDHPAPQNIEEPLRAGADTFARTHAENSHIIGEENSGNMDEGSYLITAEYDIANAMLAKTARPVSNQSAQLIDGSEIPKLQSETSNDASAFVEAQLVHKALESIESGDKNAPEATERSLGKGSQQFFEVQDLMKENGIICLELHV